MHRLRDYVYPSLRCSIPFETFYEIYKEATQKNGLYQFLVIDNRMGTKFQHGFNHVYEIESDEEDEPVKFK